ncbi:MAG: hypothetical protein ABW277_09660 [Longimicrobiaceae bacterium]
MNGVRSPIDHIPVPLRWTAAVRPAWRAQAADRGAVEDKAGQGATRAEAAVRAVRITGLLRRKR